MKFTVIITIVILIVCIITLKNNHNGIEVNKVHNVYTIYDQSHCDKVTYYILREENIVTITRLEEEFYNGKKGEVKISKNTNTFNIIKLLDELCKNSTEPAFTLPGGQHYSVEIFTGSSYAFQYDFNTNENLDAMKQIISDINHNEFTIIDSVPQFPIAGINKTAKWVFLGTRI